MNFATTVVLGGIAGLTILLGLPVARLRHLPQSLRGFLNALAIGILFFLLYDVVSKATEPINNAIANAQQGDAGHFILLVVLFVLGIGIGLLSLVYFDRFVIRREMDKAKAHEATPFQLAMMIAVGIGLHNFSEGLAIGQSARSGAIGLATILIIGFGLHNATEGFGVAAPLTFDPAATRPSWRTLLLLGMIAGGPTFLGTIVGYSIFSEAVFVFCLALAAGSILYVITELLNVARKGGFRELVMWGTFAGFMVAFLTDMVLTWGGA